MMIPRIGCSGSVTCRRSTRFQSQRKKALVKDASLFSNRSKLTERGFILKREYVVSGRPRVRSRSIRVATSRRLKRLRPKRAGGLRQRLPDPFLGKRQRAQALAGRVRDGIGDRRGGRAPRAF